MTRQAIHHTVTHHLIRRTARHELARLRRVQQAALRVPPDELAVRELADLRLRATDALEEGKPRNGRSRWVVRIVQHERRSEG